MIRRTSRNGRPRLWFRQTWFHVIRCLDSWIKKAARATGRRLRSRSVAPKHKSEGRFARSVSDARIQHRKYRLPSTGEVLPYALFVPAGYDQRSEPVPLLVSLHGLSYSYDSLLGLDGFLDAAQSQSMAVVAPLGYTRSGWYGAPDLCAGGDSWSPRSEEDVMCVIQRVRDELEVDASRIYCWGYSMGGAGALHLSIKYPHLFAALGLAAPAVGVPGEVEPFANQESLRPISHVPAMVVQGRFDRPVPVQQTRQLVDDMLAVGTDVHYIELNCGHVPPPGHLVRQLIEFVAAQCRADVDAEKLGKEHLAC